jgi:hypothetical protein
MYEEGFPVKVPNPDLEQGTKPHRLKADGLVGARISRTQGVSFQWCAHVPDLVDQDRDVRCTTYEADMY